MKELDKRIASLSELKKKLFKQQLEDRLQKGKEGSAVMQAIPKPVSGQADQKDLKFSIFFFSDDGQSEGGGKYELFKRSIQFAEDNGFHAAWVPERHFNRFGGLYPCPAALAGGIAMMTQRLQIRAGSVVLPLHNPVRVAEDWSVVDNLSEGRIGIAFASGWHPDDFILSSKKIYPQRKQVLFDHIELVKKLWRHEEVAVTMDEQTVPLKIYPAPIQKELPIWITSSKNPQTWKMAGQIGANILTGLMEQSLEEVENNIQLYHQSLMENGFDPKEREITLMLHTYLGEDLEKVKNQVREPLTYYLQQHMGLYEKMLKQDNSGIDVEALTEADKKALIDFGFQRYFKSSGLLGTPDSCQSMIDRIQKIGVTELAGLIDFGLSPDRVIEGLGFYKELMQNQTAQ